MFLRKRLIRLLKKRLNELDKGKGWPEDTKPSVSLLPEVKTNMKRIISAIEYTDLSTKKVNHSFLTPLLTNSGTQPYSQRVTKRIITDMVNDLHADELESAKKEYTVQLFSIHFITKETRKRRRLQQRLRPS